VFGVYCRRWGVPLIDGGTIRLTRMLGHSHALDLILSGRGVSGDEARLMGLANRLVAPGTALREAIGLAKQLAAFPQRCLRSDRQSSYRQWTLSMQDALREETRLGMEVLASGETAAGAARFASGAGRHGSFTEFGGGAKPAKTKIGAATTAKKKTTSAKAPKRAAARRRS
ncbi:MAG: enoyl-CoA hydratase-related protein, partial [bacterium]